MKKISAITRQGFIFQAKFFMGYWNSHGSNYPVLKWPRTPFYQLDKFVLIISVVNTNIYLK